MHSRREFRQNIFAIVSSVTAHGEGIEEKIKWLWQPRISWLERYRIFGGRVSRRTIERPLNWCPETLIHSDLQEAGNAHSATNATFRPNCLSTEKMINSMRYIFLPAVLIFLFSCKKESRQTSNSLIGKWELHQTFGGMMPTANYAPGNGNLLRFDSTHY